MTLQDTEMCLFFFICYNEIGDSMRWQIKENKRSIYTCNMEGHKEDIELSQQLADEIGIHLRIRQFT